MLTKNATARPRPDASGLLRIERVEIVADVVGAAGDQDLVVRPEQRGQPRPFVGDDRNPTGRGLEQADAGRMSDANHVGAGEVQGEALPAIKGAVVPRWNVIDPL